MLRKNIDIFIILSNTICNISNVKISEIDTLLPKLLYLYEWEIASKRSECGMLSTSDIRYEQFIIKR